MKLGACIAMLLVARAAFSRDPITGIEDGRDEARAGRAAESGVYCRRRHRSARAKQEFRRRFPCPSTGKHSGACPGWVIDHIVSLRHCGRDSASNMAWQTGKDAKRKDRWE